MLTFKPIDITDQKLITEYVNMAQLRQCDFNFINVFVWAEHWQQEYAVIDNCLVIKNIEDGIISFSFPIGNGNAKAAIDKLIEYSRELNIPFMIGRAAKEQIELLNELYPNKFTVEAYRDYFDYMYLAEALATYKGRKRNEKHRLCKRFEEAYNWSYKEIEISDLDKCIEFLDKWYLDNAKRIGGFIYDEREACMLMLRNYSILKPLGGMLMADDKIVAVSFGSMACDDTLDYNFEKIDYSYQGASAMACREYVKLAMKKYPKLVYIDREEDMGLENLRQAKSILGPEFMLEKFNAAYIES